MQTTSRRWQFAAFFLSGFAGLVYQIVWLRLAFASFGVVTPVISVVLSVFMFGLGAGSWIAGTMLVRRPLSRSAALRAYAAAEFLIGVGGLAVPTLFAWGDRAILPAGESDSVRYLLASAASILLALAPFCLCMGATFPLMMQAIRAERQQHDSFSYLYLANVLGAMCGTLLTPLALVELFGFRETLAIAVGANVVAGLTSLVMSFVSSGTANGQSPSSVSSADADAAENFGTFPGSSRVPVPSRFPLWVLFTTGLTSMGMEVVWTRAFVPVLRTQVYSFAGLLFTYLLATWCGSALYRRELSRGRVLSAPLLLSLLCLSAFGQLLQSDPRIVMPRTWLQVGWVLFGIVPYCALLGYLTPKLIDEFSWGRPGPAGRAYAVNVLGCILGPLLVSYGMLPRWGVHTTGLVLALPLWALAGLAVLARRQEEHTGTSGAETTFTEGTAPSPGNGRPVLLPRWLWAASTVGGVLAATASVSYEELYAARDALVFRDHTATVIATVDQETKLLFVNGTLITTITPSTKLMAHLPLAYLPREPRSALVICFGMGSTYRSLLSWDVDVTAIELVPSVRDAFGYFFADADDVLRNPRGRIVIDDGRRFLRRTTERFDVITLDPPPPAEAAASSLLYSREFYQLVKARLTDGGILHQWYPAGEAGTFEAVLRAVRDEFPHVQVFRAFDGYGTHILASLQPLGEPTAAELAARLPEAARHDLLEWTPGHSDVALLDLVVSSRSSVEDLLDPTDTIAITDDRPYNEFYLLRRLRRAWNENDGTDP
jgi:spermidine synthase